jgi:hypothetical protein
MEQPLTPDFIRFADEELLPRLEFSGYKVARKERIARFILNNLITSGLMGRAVSDTRSTQTNRLRTEVWDAIVKAKMARMAVGSELSRRVTRYCATSWLLERQEMWELRLLCAHEELAGLVVLTSGKVDWLTGLPLPGDQQRKPVPIRERIEATAQRDPDDLRKPDPGAVENGLAYFRALEDVIESINANNLAHSWVARGRGPGADGKGRLVSFQPSVTLRQVHSGQLFRCVRLYTWGPMGAQSMTREQRQSVLIDGEPVVELDFSGYATRMLYHLNHLDPRDDVYKPEQVCPRSYPRASRAKKKLLRDLIKCATNICWNTKSRAQAQGAVKKLLGESPKDVQRTIYTIEESGASDLLTRVEDAHPELKAAGKFYSEPGLDLMTADGNVMKNILLRFVKAQKPALGVHDSVVVKATDAEFAAEVMNDVYQSFFGYLPVIHRA